MNTLTRATILAAALGLSVAVTGCSTLRTLTSSTSSAKSEKKAQAKSKEDIAACEKMCEVAGNAEDNKGAIANCQKKCR